MPVGSSDIHARRILSEIESGRPLSQRTLSRDLGIALGLTNLLLRKMTRKGWIRLVHVKPNRVRYLITPAGVTEKARMSRAYFQQNVAFYAETRDRIRQVFDELSLALDRDVHGRPKAIVFVGAGEVAEIGFVCLHDSDLQLVGVVDGRRREPFFSIPVSSMTELRADRLGDRQFERAIIMRFDPDQALRDALARADVPPERICWL